MGYVPLSLRYRPQTFEQIVGQEHVSRTLQNAVSSGRVVHAYLFAGPRGTGKTSTARVLAKALLCENGPTPHPCGKCDICLAIAEGRCLDVIEIDAASNRGIEQIRELREKVRYSPAQARYKVYILDEVHMLTPEAFNALLKTLEEPPAHAFFVLATTELHRVPPTIVSRCQLFEFHLIGEGQIKQALRDIAEREGIDVDDAAIEEVARAARGALRDAESIFDQVVAYADGAITADVVRDVLGVTPRDAVAGLVRALATGQVGTVLSRLDELVALGKDLPQLLQDITLATRDMLRMALAAKATGEWSDLADAARSLGPERIAEGLRLLGEAEKRLRDAVQQQVALELALVEICEAWARQSGQQFARTAAETARRKTAAKAEPDRPAPGREVAGPQKPPTRTGEGTRHDSAAPSGPQPAEEAPAEGVGQPDGEAAERAKQPAAAPSSVEELAAQWHQVHHELRRMRRVALWAMVRNGSPIGMEGDVLIVRFEPKWKMHAELIDRRYRQDVERAISRVLQREVKLRCVVGDEQPRATEAHAASRARPLLPRAEEPQATVTESVEEPPPQPEKQEQPSGAADAVDRAAELTLEIFPDSEEVEPE